VNEHTWEYRHASLGGLFQSFDLDGRVNERMNTLGREGWELVTSHRSWITGRYRLVFKRPIQLRAAVRDVG
jgi:hypothetical protein